MSMTQHIVPCLLLMQLTWFAVGGTVILVACLILHLHRVETVQLRVTSLTVCELLNEYSFAVPSGALIGSHVSYYSRLVSLTSRACCVLPFTQSYMYYLD